MARLTREALLGASDLREEEVELPSIDGSVVVRSLPAAYSNQAQSEALEMVTLRGGEQSARVNTAKLEALQVLHALVDPKLTSLEEVNVLAQRIGPAWRTMVDKIDEISGVNKKAIEETNARFRSGGQAETVSATPVNGAGSGDDGPDLRVPAGPSAPHAD